MYAKILVPLDGSATAHRGFEEAVALARALGSTLVLTHVVDTFPIAVEMITTTTWQEIGDGLRKHGQTLLDTACQTATTHGVEAEPQLVEAGGERVADILLAQARDSGCDLIVMGTHGRRGFSHAMLGSDAERVLHEAPVPVLLVRHPESRRR